MKGSYLGPAYSQDEIEAALTAAGAKFEVLPEQEMIRQTAQALADGKAVGWFQGRMEFGPRALGARSILGDPRSETMQRTLNLKVKYRESFRPFAPSVLSDAVSDWFDFEGESPYMLMVAEVRDKHRRQMTPEQQQLFGIEKLNVARSTIPAVTHVDYSARLQTVHRRYQSAYHALISRFGYHGLPHCRQYVVQCSRRAHCLHPEDAFRCFMGTDIEWLAIGNCVLRKEDQDPALSQEHKAGSEPII